MKKILCILCSFTVFIFSHAQSDKDLKTEAKEYVKNPEGLRTLKTRSKELADSLKLREESLLQCEKSERLLRAEFGELLARYDSLLKACNPQEVTKTVEKVIQNNGIPQEGVAFTIQIGAYQNTNLSDYTNADLQTEEGKVNKYILGVFRKYDEAEQLKVHLKNMGLKDAWIVSYRDGQRVNIEDVLTPEEIQRRKDRGY